MPSGRSWVVSQRRPPLPQLCDELGNVRVDEAQAVRLGKANIRYWSMVTGANRLVESSRGCR